MKKWIITGVVVVLLGLLFVYGKPYKSTDPHSGSTDEIVAPAPSSPSEDDASDSSPDSGHASGSASVAPAGFDSQTVTLVDQSFESASDAHGIDRIRAMHTVKLTGNIQDAVLHVEMSRNGQNEGTAALFAYTAKLDEDGQVIPSTEWTHFRALDSAWQGKCGTRVIAGGSNFLSGEGEMVDDHFALSAVPFSVGDDGCDTSTESVDLLAAINDGGIALGFYPSNQGYHVKAWLEYSGDLTVTNF